MSAANGRSLCTGRDLPSTSRALRRELLLASQPRQQQCVIMAMPLKYNEFDDRKARKDKMYRPSVHAEERWNDCWEVPGRGRGASFRRAGVEAGSHHGRTSTGLRASHVGQSRHDTSRPTWRCKPLTPSDAVLASSVDMSNEPQSKPATTRRSHKKTRTGCAQCKQRRVKVCIFTPLQITRPLRSAHPSPGLLARQCPFSGIALALSSLTLW